MGLKNDKTVVCKNAGKDFLIGFTAGLICVGAIVGAMLGAYILL